MIELYVLFYSIFFQWLWNTSHEDSIAHRKISGRPPDKDIVTEPKFIVIFMGVKASYGVGLESAPARGCPCSIKCFFKDIRSALTLSIPPPSFFLFVILEMSRQIKMCSTNRRDLPLLHPFPFAVGMYS
jgi:hypothetical protein